MLTHYKVSRQSSLSCLCLCDMDSFIAGSRISHFGLQLFCRDSIMSEIQGGGGLHLSYDLQVNLQGTVVYSSLRLFRDLAAEWPLLGCSRIQDLLVIQGSCGLSLLHVIKIDLVLQLLQVIPGACDLLLVTDLLVFLQLVGGGSRADGDL